VSECKLGQCDGTGRLKSPPSALYDLVVCASCVLQRIEALEAWRDKHEPRPRRIAPPPESAPGERCGFVYFDGTSVPVTCVGTRAAHNPNMVYDHPFQPQREESNR
jgi:hypothetical protein